MSALRVVSAVLVALALPALALAQGVGVSPEGQKGRIHVVAQGDTLWDIADTYLGTPWIWPSLWKENAGIANPHLIYPGDHIWITEGEMRKLTPEEAARLLRGDGELLPITPDQIPARLPEIPAAPSLEEDEVSPREDPFASLDQGVGGNERVLHYEGLHRYGFVTPTEYAGTGAIMGSHDPNYWASQQQKTIVSMGEGTAHTGDNLTIFRTRRRILHPDTREVLGYFIEILGRGEISEIHPEASFMKIVNSYSEIAPGDRVMAYEEQPTEFVEVHSEDFLDGRIIAHQPYRLRGGAGDFVLLDVGVREGVSPGRRFELYRPGREVRDPATLNQVLVPDDVLGQAFVVKVSEKMALALVTRARTDVLVGDGFRTRR